MEPVTTGRDGWLTPAQAARRLEITPTRVRQLTAEGKLRFVATPLGRLIDPDSVDARAAERAGARGVPDDVA